jgi:hypothetical protein
MAIGSYLAGSVNAHRPDHCGRNEFLSPYFFSDKIAWLLYRAQAVTREQLPASIRLWSG